MNIILSPEQEYEKWLDETRQKAQVGIQQLERGEKVDGEFDSYNNYKRVKIFTYYLLLSVKLKLTLKGLKLYTD